MRVAFKGEDFGMLSERRSLYELLPRILHGAGRLGVELNCGSCVQACVSGDHQAIAIGVVESKSALQDLHMCLGPPDMRL